MPSGDDGLWKTSVEDIEDSEDLEDFERILVPIFRRGTFVLFQINYLEEDIHV